MFASVEQLRGKPSFLHSSPQTGSVGHGELGGSALALLRDREIGLKMKDESVKESKLSKEQVWYTRGSVHLFTE